MAVSVVPSSNPDDSLLAALNAQMAEPSGGVDVASEAAVTSKTKTVLPAPILGRPNPQDTDDEYAATAAVTSAQISQDWPPARAWSSPARTKRPRITCACVRKNKSGTALDEVSTSAAASPKANRVAKSASIGAAII
jgi:hypothetical protein